jgi:hypothetical protein
VVEVADGAVNKDPGRAAKMMIPALACSVELITADSQLHPLRRGALLTDPEIFETLAVPRVGSQPPSIAGNFSNLDDTEAGLREILAAKFAGA